MSWIGNLVEDAKKLYNENFLCKLNFSSTLIRSSLLNVYTSAEIYDVWQFGSWVMKNEEICLNFHVLSMVITCQNRDIYTDNLSNFHSILLIMSNSISSAYPHRISAFCESLQLHSQSGSVKWKIYRNIEIIFSNHSQFRQTHTSLNFTSHFTSISLLHCHFSRLLCNINTHSSRAPEPKPEKWVYANASKGNAKHIHNFLSTFSLACQLTVIKKYKHIYGIIRAKSHANSRCCSFLSTFMRRMNHWLISNDNFPLSLRVWFLSLSFTPSCHSVCDILIGTLRHGSARELSLYSVLSVQFVYSVDSLALQERDKIMEFIYILFPSSLLFQSFLPPLTSLLRAVL